MDTNNFVQMSNTYDSNSDHPPQFQVNIGNNGLKKRIIRLGHAHQTPFHGDEVEVHYSGHVKDGSSLSWSHDNSTPFKFKLGQGEVIEGLDKGVATMKKGEKAILIVPPHLAYGEAGYPPLIPPNSTLIFDVEMITWTAIRDITGDGGVLKKIIVEGEGWSTPKLGDEVLVKYEAMLDDGVVVSKSNEEGVKFLIGDGQLCPAIHKAARTMRTNEEAELSVRFSYGFEVHVVDTIRLNLLSWRTVVDVLGNNKILKKIISVGEGFDHPSEGSSIKVVYVGKSEDGAIFDQKGSLDEPFEYMCLEEQVINEGLDRAIMTMKKGEKAQVCITSDYLQGNVTSETDLTDSRILYEVELLDFTKEEPFWKMDTQEKLKACLKKKEEGNLLFKEGKFLLASNKYEKATKCIEFNHSFSDEEKHSAKELMLSCNLNNAACKLKLGDFSAAAALCSKVIELDPNNIKALFRRSQAYVQTSDLDKAEADIIKALAIDPNNREMKLEHKVVKAKQKEYAKYQAELFGTMISKMV